MTLYGKICQNLSISRYFYPVLLVLSLIPLHKVHAQQLEQHWSFEALQIRYHFEVRFGAKVIMEGEVLREIQDKGRLENLQIRNPFFRIGVFPESLRAFYIDHRNQECHVIDRRVDLRERMTRQSMESMIIPLMLMDRKLVNHLHSEKQLQQLAWFSRGTRLQNGRKIHWIDYQDRRQQVKAGLFAEGSLYGLLAQAVLSRTMLDGTYHLYLNVTEVIEQPRLTVKDFDLPAQSNCPRL